MTGVGSTEPARSGGATFQTPGAGAGSVTGTGGRELKAKGLETRRRLLLLPEPNATQLRGLVARLGALAADAESQLR